MKKISATQGNLFLQYLIVTFLAGTLYYISVAPGVLWQDSGLAQIRVLTHDFTGKLGLALAHPLYYLIAHLFQLIPLKDSASKTNLVSAVFGTLTVANIYLFLVLILKDISHRQISAIVGTLSLALAHTFWQHCALAEVYSVSTFFITCELLALVKFIHTNQARWYLLVWMINGVECSNHLLATITLAAIIVWTIFRIKSGEFNIRWMPLAILLWIIGAIPYEYLGLQAWLSGQSISDVIHSMLFGHYEKQVLNTHIDLRLILSSLAIICLNFPTPNIFLIPTGLIKAPNIINKSIYNLLLIATGLHLLFAIRYSVPDQYTFFIVPVLFLSIWIGLGSAWLINKIEIIKFPLILFAIVPPLFYAILPALINKYKPSITSAPIPYRNEAEYFFQPWKTNYIGPQKLAEEIFKIAPKNSIIIANGTSARPLLYYQIAYKKRPDLKIVFSLFKNDSDKTKIAKLENLIKTKSVFIIRPYPGYCPDWILNNFELEKIDSIYKIKRLKTKQRKTNKK